MDDVVFNPAAVLVGWFVVLCKWSCWMVLLCIWLFVDGPSRLTCYNTLYWINRCRTVGIVCRYKCNEEKRQKEEQNDGINGSNTALLLFPKQR